MREVALIRAHLAPIRSRAGLAAALGAVTATTASEREPGAVRVAYALRWLELGSGRAWASAWPPPGVAGSRAFA